jgi:hypothetical protein
LDLRAIVTTLDEIDHGYRTRLKYLAGKGSEANLKAA